MHEVGSLSSERLLLVVTGVADSVFLASVIAMNYVVESVIELLDPKGLDRLVVDFLQIAFAFSTVTAALLMLVKNVTVEVRRAWGKLSAR